MIRILLQILGIVILTWAIYGLIVGREDSDD